MADSNSATIVAHIINTMTRDLNLNDPSDVLNYKKTWTLTNGEGANKAEAVFHDQRTITASNNEDLDLAGSLTDPFGQTLTFTDVKFLAFYAATGNTNNVQITRPACNSVPVFLAASDGLALKPGGFFMLVDPSDDGIAVTAGTGDLINVANSGGGSSVTYDVIIIGEIS